MINIIITSEMRVGSRWVHYLLRDLLNMKVSGEIDVKELPHCSELIQHRFQENRIVKFHHATPLDIWENIDGNYKIIGIVRDPRDRVVSWTFHQRYKPVDRGLQIIKDAKNDAVAVKTTYNLKQSKEDNERQFMLMREGRSTRGTLDGEYIWTCYHWLINDTFREIKKIVKFLGFNIPDERIKEVIKKNSFKNKSGRTPGYEKRDDDWRRKGIERDYNNWFTEQMVTDSGIIAGKYWRLIRAEENAKKNI